jgi:hypothetical protein
MDEAVERRVEGEVQNIRAILNSVVNRVPYGGKNGLV